MHQADRPSPSEPILSKNPSSLYTTLHWLEMPRNAQYAISVFDQKQLNTESHLQTLLADSNFTGMAVIGDLTSSCRTLFELTAPKTPIHTFRMETARNTTS
jgi:hypothetical protein